MTLASVWLHLFTLALANTHLERCKATIGPALEDCNGNHDCKCNVLARAGAKCLRSAPAGSLVDLIRSVDDGACMRTHFMDLSVLDNLASLETDDSTINMADFYNQTNSSNPDVLQEIYDNEDAREEQLANRFVDWIDDRMGVVYDRNKQDTSMMSGPSMLERLVTGLMRRLLQT